MRHSPAHMLYPVLAVFTCLLTFTASLADADDGIASAPDGQTAAAPDTDSSSVTVAAQPAMSPNAVTATVAPAATAAQPAANPPAVAGRAAPDARPVKQQASEDATGSQNSSLLFSEQKGLFDRRLTLETELSYAHYNRKQLSLSGFLALDAIFLGNIDVDAVKANTLMFDVTGRYALTDRLQLDLNTPFLYRSTDYQSAGAGGASSVISAERVTTPWKAGDISMGLNYQWWKEDGKHPDLFWSLRFKAPTGSNPYGVKLVSVPGNDNLKVPAELSSGNGLWAISPGLTISKTVDPAVLFASLSYTHNLQRHFSDISSDVGKTLPGSIDMGDIYQFGFGAAFALNDSLALNVSYAQRFNRTSRLKYDGGNWTGIVGSDANAGVLNLGATYGISNHQSVIVNVGAGLTPDAPNTQLSLKYVSSY